MSDLSRLLDDVYGPSDTAAPEAPPAPAPSSTGLPDWALDSVLDDAFSDWMPGSSAEPAEEPTAPVAVPVLAAATVAVAPQPVAVRPWARSDDDILPVRRGRAAKGDDDVVAAPVAAEPSEELAAAKGRFRLRKG